MLPMNCRERLNEWGSAVRMTTVAERGTDGENTLRRGLHSCTLKENLVDMNVPRMSVGCTSVR